RPGRKVEERSRYRSFQGFLSIDRLAFVPVEYEINLLRRHFAAQKIGIRPRQVDALLAREGRRPAGAGRRLEIADVVHFLQNLFGAIAADASAVLAVNFPAPAAEETLVVGCLSAQAEDAPIIIDLLAAVVVVGDRQRADGVYAGPSIGPGRREKVAGAAIVPDLTPAILI